jgi:hypothetical protein
MPSCGQDPKVSLTHVERAWVRSAGFPAVSLPECANNPQVADIMDDFVIEKNLP